VSVRSLLAVAAAMLLFGPACRKAASDEDAIRAAILRHLQKNSGLNLSAMDTQFQQITRDGDHAQAQVEFRTKQEGATMQMTYALERRGGEWTVLNGHPAGGQIAHPPMDGAHGAETAPAMPRFHVPGDAHPKPAPTQSNAPTG
jgi:hypothetical protein